MPEGEDGRRRSFGPVVLAGLVTAGTAVLAATRPWFGGGREAVQDPLPGMPSPTVAATYPAASAVSLVLLAAWGIVLVTRGRTRRVFAIIAVIGAAGLLATVVTAGLDPPDPGSSAPGGVQAAATTLTVWFWVAGVASVLALATAALAVRLAPGWPEMSRRYDAPGASGAPLTEQDLWHRLDAGDDPTDPPAPDRPDRPA